MFGKLRGRHCGLCDITHGIVREKSAFRDLTCSLSMPVDVWHRNEQTPEVARFTAGITPCVVGRSGAELVVLLDAVELEAMDGDVDRFARAPGPHGGRGPRPGLSGAVHRQCRPRRNTTGMSPWIPHGVH